ncbi:CopG family transcriptional regulator [Nostoc sp. 2RC]|uniref:ribbon-helix-helix domain-containing protein n=1 Tax=Nostoc sp. 2RC TaxID=2485484 RepID=UPI001629858F|nr:CopG family transcriptional regulator [Nostoc sp. 2RC]MBC1240556.1 ribbon-helix-helix protein, CopG family [Nostoc sp. 2RC]
MPKGSKRVKGVPELQDELKTRVNLSLTPTAIANLDVMANERGISKSELVERIARRQIPLKDYSDPLRDASVADLVERMIRELPPLDITVSTVKFIPFNNREELPNSPGAFLITDWQFEYNDFTNDLKERLMDEKLIKSLLEVFKEKEDNILLFWIECNDARLCKILQKELQSVFKGIREDIISQSLSRELQKKNFSQSNEQLFNDLYAYLNHIASTGKKIKLTM